MIVLYFPKPQHKSIEYSRFFVDEFLKATDEDIGVFFESTEDVFAFEREVTWERNIEIVDLEKAIKEIRVSQAKLRKICEKYSYINFNKYFFIEEHNISADFEVFVVKMLVFCEKYFIEREINFIHFGINQAFRSLGIAVLDEFRKTKGVPLFMVWNSTLKGRHFCYDNLAHQPYSISDEYSKLISKPLAKNVIAVVDKYIGAYEDFYREIYNRHLYRLEKWGSSVLRPMTKDSQLIKPPKAKGNSKSLWHTLRSYVNRGKAAEFYCRIQYQKYVDKYDRSRPYVLLLLNKGNSWRTKSALPYFNDISALAKAIWMSLPLGYSLVVKDHPLSPFPAPKRAGLYDLAKKCPNVFCLTQKFNTRKLVKKAEMVLFTCSTSGVEALMNFKHAIVFGERPVFFDFPDAPVEKVRSFEDLPAAIHRCLTTAPPREKIYAYFYTLLKKSDNFNGDKDINSINFVKDEAYFRGLAHYVVEQAQENGLL